MMNLFLFVARSSRVPILFAILVGLISGGANALLISLITREIAAIEDGSALVGPLYFCGVVAVVFASGLISQFILIGLSQRLAFNLRVNLCEQILRQPLRTLEETGGARLMATFTKDVPSIALALLQIPTFSINVAVALGCMVYLGLLSLWVMVALIVFLGVAVAAYLVPEKVAIGHGRRMREAWDHMLEDFSSLEKGAKELKLHANKRRSFFFEIMVPSTKAFRDRGFSFRILYAVLGSISQLAFFLFLGFLLFVVPIWQELSLETLVGFAFVALYIREPIIGLVNSMPTFRDAGIAFEALAKIGLTPDGRDVDLDKHIDRMFPKPDDNPPLRRIELDGVRYAFFNTDDDRHFTLGPLSLELDAGEIAFIVGGNGSGKTTLAKVLTGLYAPDEGEIRVNGEPVTEEGRERYRQYFSAVFNNFHLFQQLLGHEEDQSLGETVTAYLEDLALAHKVKWEGRKLSTISLSTGQRKRLALLVTYLEDRSVYLFDEWAADQDPQFREVFYTQLLPELKARGKTVLVISHDDRYFHLADRIYHLVDGHLDPEHHPEAIESV